jgi:hypothetical protein
VHHDSTPVVKRSRKQNKFLHADRSSILSVVCHAACMKRLYVVIIETLFSYSVVVLLLRNCMYSFSIYVIFFFIFFCLDFGQELKPGEEPGTLLYTRVATHGNWKTLMILNLFIYLFLFYFID